MRILILGHTGLGKRQVVENLANAYLAGRGLETGLKHIESREHVRIACLEDEFPGTAAKVDVRGFLDIKNEFGARQIWRDALDAAIDKLDLEDADSHKFLSMHATYYRSGVIYSRAELEAISEGFQPDRIVTLIDDVYDVSAEIRGRDDKDALRLREITTWRAVELLVGDFIARMRKIDNFVVAVKHPTSVLLRLLFEPDLQRLYCAFPISRTRASAADRAEINDFKTRLRETGAVVFDPTTIDDLALVHALGSQKDGEATLRDADRWENADEPLLIDGRERAHAGNEKTFAVAEIEEVARDLSRQVETRDFRLIEDSQGVVAYRPNWGGSPSRGVAAELQFAQNRGRRVFIYSPPKDKGSVSSFDQFQNRYGSVDELLQAVTNWG